MEAQSILTYNGVVMKLATLFLALLLAGCVPNLDALARDKNPLCARVTWISGSVEINRDHGCEPQFIAVPRQQVIP